MNGTREAAMLEAYYSNYSEQDEAILVNELGITEVQASLLLESSNLDVETLIDEINEDGGADSINWASYYGTL